MLTLNDNYIIDISPLGALTNLHLLQLDRNRIVDISSLTSLTNLMTEARYERLSQALTIRHNRLSLTSVNVYIPQLEEQGVLVWWESLVNF